MSGPQCQVCGAGKLFPMMPANQHRAFGTICDECDCREMQLLGQWRGGPVPASVKAACESTLKQKGAQ